MVSTKSFVSIKIQQLKVDGGRKVESSEIEEAAFTCYLFILRVCIVPYQTGSGRAAVCDLVVAR